MDAMLGLLFSKSLSIFALTDIKSTDKIQKKDGESYYLSLTNTVFFTSKKI